MSSHGMRFLNSVMIGVLRYVGGEQTAHLFDVLCVLLFDNVHDVVGGDDAHQTVLVVHDGDAHQVVFAHRVGDDLLIVQRLDRYEVGRHDVGDRLVLIGENQMPQRDGAHQMALAVDDIAGVDGFLVQAGLAQRFHRLAHGHGAVELGKLDGHDRAGRIFRVFEELVDQRALCGIGVLQDALDDRRGQLLEEIDRVVQEHFVQQGVDFAVADQRDQLLLLLAVDIGEHFRRDVLGQYAEHHQQLFALKALHKRGDIDHVEHEQRAAQFIFLIAVHQLHQPAVNDFAIHGKTPSFHVCGGWA